MTGMARQHALESCADLRLTADEILAAYDIVESALGSEWLESHERQSDKHRVKISDAHTLIRLLATPTNEAHAEICELALYLRSFATDPAISSVIQDLRTDKYVAVLMELAFAYRWRDAGAQVRLRPTTARGEADFEAMISGLRYVVETSLFAGELFKQPRFRLPQIMGQAMGKVSFGGPVKVFVTIREYPKGNIDSQIFEMIRDIGREFVVGGSSTTRRDFAFADVVVEAIAGDTEYNPFIEAAEGEPWDICFQHVKRELPAGEPIYRVLDHRRVEEASRIFVKFPETTPDIYDAIYRKLKREATQLAGVQGPRVVILDTGALGDITDYDADTLKPQLARLMRGIPELACVWISMRRFLRENRHRYYSLYVPNPDSTYQIPNDFLTRYGMREWRWDYLAGKEF